jgi:opacity protein-like surface antigen
MQRRAATTLAIVMCVSSSAAPAWGQRFGAPNQALDESFVDASARGPGSGGFLEIARTRELSWFLSGGFMLGRGTLRASYAEGYRRRLYGLGYGVQIAERQVGMFGTLGTGVDLAAGYDHSPSFGYSPRAMRVAIPLSLRWGSMSRFSFSPYLAPYAELGRARQFHVRCESFTCTGPVTYSTDVTRAAGIGAGFELTVWRLGLEYELRDLFVRQDYPDFGPTPIGYRAKLGLRLNF